MIYHLLIKYGLLIIAFLVSLTFASILVRKGIPRLDKSISPEKVNKAKLFKDLGFWIGFFEHVIIFVLVMNKEFSALAIIFGAKELVRKEQIKTNPAYYLLGTLINFGVALVMAEIITEILKLPCISR
jgi:hypothetical protein